MAIIRPGVLVQAISGSVGATNFAAGRGGPTARLKATKQDQKTQRQNDRRRVFQRAIRHWQGLTDVEQAQWRQAARNRMYPNRLGVPRNLTGYQFYLKTALLFGAAGLDFPDSPTDLLPGCPLRFISFGADASPNSLWQFQPTLTTSSGCTDPNDWAQAQGAVTTKGILPSPNDFVDFGTKDWGPWPLGLFVFSEPFGLFPAEGQTAWLRMRSTPPLRPPGPWATTSTIVTPP